MAAIALGFAAHDWATAQEQEPAPELRLSKLAEKETVERGDVLGFVIVATNSGTLAARVTIHDSLPAGYDWFFVSVIGDGDCGVLDGHTIECTAALRERHLEEQESGEVIFVNGRFTVILRAVAHTACQTVENFATLTHEDTTLVDGATVDVTGCATPTPTATSTPTPTATATPTSTATATPTSTAIPATPTRVRTAAPGPPNTGTGSTPPATPMATMLFLALSVSAIAFGIGGVAIAKRSR